MWIRRVLVPGLTDDPAELQQLKDFIDSLSSVEKVEILPYHTLGLFKWQNLGIEYPLEGVPVPTPEQVQQAETILGIANKPNGIAILVAMPFFFFYGLIPFTQVVASAAL